MINLGAVSAAGAGITTGVSPYYNLINGLLQSAKAANDTLASVPMSTPRREEMLHTYRDVIAFGQDLLLRVTTASSDPLFAADYRDFATQVSAFTKSVDRTTPAAPPAAPRIPQPDDTAMVLPEESSTNWWLWGGLGAAALGGAAFWYHRTQRSRRRR